MIAIEGIDGVGKTTQTDALEEYLGKENILRLRFPTRTGKIGGKIDEALRHARELPKEELYELFVKNKFEYQEKILSTLERGHHVLIDRYYHSGVAYGAGAMGLDCDTCISKENSLPPVDILIYLEAGEQSKTFCNLDTSKAELWEKKTIQEQVNTVYEYLISQRQNDLVYKNLIKIPYNLPVYTVTSKIQNILDDVLKV